MLVRAIPLLSALALLLSSPSQAALVSAAPTSLPPATSENASTAFLSDGSESRIGLLCHNDPINKTDPYGDDWLDNVQTGLDVAGFVPGIGEFADLGSGLISLGRGDLTGAGMSLGAMVPVGGQVAGAAKLARKGEAAIKRAENIKKGIPPSHLGPSGEPKRHTVAKATDKRAREAARQAGHQKPVKDTKDKGQGPHYHAVDREGNRLKEKDNIHYKKRGD